jgi:hypothetical protein
MTGARTVHALRQRIVARSALGVAAVVGWAVAALPGLGQDRVRLHGEPEPLHGLVTEVTPAGVLVRVPPLGSDDPTQPGARLVLVALDRVQSVSGPGEPLFRPYASTATGLWRARTRMERGDLALAEEALRDVLDPAEVPTGPTGMVTAELVLRARLTRGWTGGALWPWLQWLHAKRQRLETPGQPQWVGQSTSAAPVVDAEMGLCPSLPPVFSARVNRGALEALAESPEASGVPESDPVVRELKELYLFAARWELAADNAERSAALPASRSADPGVTFVREIVQARTASPDLRAQARARLSERLANELTERSLAARDPRATPDPPRWVELWCRLGIGRSLVREEAPEQRRRGVLELVSVAARAGDSAPTFSLIALAEAAEELRSQGDTAAAEVLAAEARRIRPWISPAGPPGLEPAPGRR